MAKKSPLGKIKDAADLAVGTGQKVVEQAVGQAVAVAGVVSTKLPGRKRAAAPTAAARPGPVAEPRKTEGDPVKPTVKKTPAKKSPAKKAAAKKSPAKKTATKKTATKKTATKKTATKKTAKKASAKKTAAKKA